jgi:hypothetical protein
LAGTTRYVGACARQPLQQRPSLADADGIRADGIIADGILADGILDATRSAGAAIGPRYSAWTIRPCAIRPGLSGLRHSASILAYLGLTYLGLSWPILAYLGLAYGVAARRGGHPAMPAGG